MLDLAVIGAGPSGLAVGVAAKQAGLTCSLFDRGPIVSSLLRYPLFMRFFSTPEKLEIGGLPFVASEDKPTRREALTYYRKVAEYFELDVRQYHTVERVTPETGGFELVARHRGAAEPEIVGVRNVVCATGYFDSPNLLGVPGEDLPHVSHFFTEPHPYWQQSVVVVGGGNSAVEAALEVHRVGARVTLVHFLGEFDRGVKPWILPDIMNRLKDGSIAARWRSRVAEIGPRHVLIRCETDGSTETVQADFVLALTGYRADLTLLRAIGVTVDEETGVPRHAPETMETNVPGVYIAGVVAAGVDANKIFIENGRLHGGLICAHIKSKPSRVAPGGSSPARHRAP
ncbi:MAG TPA: YpdA family putative bacillithiol disulfide reductase [Gemmatimonadales bacterium]|jgi:thioredoxin reductase (NADPH)